MSNEYLDITMKKVIKQEVNALLDKIIEDIYVLETYYDNDYFSGNRDAMFKCKDVLQIINKYKVEEG